jgi:hypothetical protein
MYIKIFKKFDHIDCKIIVFEGKRWASFIPCKISSTNFEYSWLKIFALHKVEAFDIVWGNWVTNP